MSNFNIFSWTAKMLEKWSKTMNQIFTNKVELVVKKLKTKKSNIFVNIHFVCHFFETIMLSPFSRDFLKSSNKVEIPGNLRHFCSDFLLLPSFHLSIGQTI